MRTNLHPLEPSTIINDRASNRRFLRVVHGAPRVSADDAGRRELALTEGNVRRSERLKPARVLRLAEITGLSPRVIRQRERVFCSPRSTTELADAVAIGAIDLEDASEIVREADRRFMPKPLARWWVNQRAMALLATDLREANLGISIY